MRLLLHVGTEKTGSSFLQTLCARHRGALRQQGLYFPPGTRHDEGCMAKGRISAGNGRILAQMTEQGQWDALRARLKTIHDAAAAQGARGVLLSSEHLLAPLSTGANSAQWDRITSDLGYADVQILVILRDPVGQFLSLYKHRAKRGTAGTVSQWAHSGYDLPQHLAALRQTMTTSKAALTVRAYDRAEGALAQVFFADWLGIRPPAQDKPLDVNPSLALSELAMLRLLADRHPRLVVPLYEYLLKIDPAQKLQGQALEVHARAVAEQAVAAHASEWQAWNALLPEGEALAIPDPGGPVPPEPNEIGFSEAQLAAMMQYLGTSATFRFLMEQIWTNHIRPIAGIAKRAVIGSDLR